MYVNIENLIINFKSFLFFIKLLKIMNTVNMFLQIIGLAIINY